MAKVSHNIPKDPLRWPILRASSEFKLDRLTLTRRLTAAGIEPAEDGCFSTSEIVSAIIGGDHAAERLRLTREKADETALANAKTRGEYLEAGEVARELESLFCVLKQEIAGNPDLSQAAKESLLSHLAQSDLRKRAND
jgi:phage terminase Nu1 subunit (DNA packaging protein)